MKDVVVEKQAYLKVATYSTRARFRLQGIGVACTDGPSRLSEPAASLRPCEEATACFDGPLWQDVEDEMWTRGQTGRRDSVSSDGWLAELDALTKLPHGWDSYSAPAPSAGAVKNAKALVIEAGSQGTDPERVEPSAMGGVGVTFSAGRREVVVEFYNNGTAHALLSDDATGDMSTRAVPITRDGYRGIIGEARKHLYGEETAI